MRFPKCSSAQPKNSWFWIPLSTKISEFSWFLLPKIDVQIQGTSSQSVFFETPVRISNYDIFKNWGFAGWSQGSTIKCFITWKASNLNYLTDENFLALFPLYCPQNQNKHKIFIFKTKYWTKIGNYCIYQIIEIEQKLF